MRVRESCEVKGVGLSWRITWWGRCTLRGGGKGPVFVGDVNADGLIGVADILLVLSVLETACAP